MSHNNPRTVSACIVTLYRFPFGPQKSYTRVISLLLVCFSSFAADQLCWSCYLAILVLIKCKAEHVIHFFRALEHELLFTLDSPCPALLHNFSQCGDQPVLQSALQPHQQYCSIDQSSLPQDPDDLMPPACHFALPRTTQRVEIPRLFVN